MASMSLSGTSDSGADEETVGDERGSGSLTITVHDRRVLLDSMSNPPSLYALCRAWLQVATHGSSSRERSCCSALGERSRSPECAQNDADVPTLGPQPPRPRRAAATSVGQGREAAGGAEARREASDEAKAREGDGAEPGGETSNGAEAGQGPAEKVTARAGMHYRMPLLGRRQCGSQSHMLRRQRTMLTGTCCGGIWIDGARSSGRVRRRPSRPCKITSGSSSARCHSRA